MNKAAWLIEEIIKGKLIKEPARKEKIGEEEG